MSERPAALLPAKGPDFAAALAAPPVPNLQRIGGEMFAWTDRDPRRGPAAPHGAVLRHLVLQLTGPDKTVLVAGPHADELVAAMAANGARVSWLVRSLADGEQAARLHPTVTILCGAAVKLDPAAQFDVVVAADGVSRLNSTEGKQMAPSELIERLTQAVRPDGALLLMHDNHFGLHHTVRLDPGVENFQDAEWYPADEHDTDRPASQQQLVDRLTDAGLTIDAAYAAFPEPSQPTVLIGERLLGDVSSPLRPRLGTALAQAFTQAFRRRPVLTDPRRLMTRALRAGAEDAVAAAWLVIARVPSSSDAPIGERHDLLVGDAEGTFTYEVTVDGAELRTTVLQPLEGTVERAGMRRIGEAAAPGADAGYVLEERLLHLCAAKDLRQLRAELGQFDSWLTGQAHDGVLTGPAALAGVADVLVTADGPVLLPARWEPIEPVRLDIATTRALWQFAVQLITAGHPHPWPITSSAVDLTAALLGMVGRGVDQAHIRTAVDLQVAIETADYHLTLGDQHDRVLQLLAVTPGTASVDVPGYHELVEALWRQRYQAGNLLAMMEWTEQIVASRDLQLSKLDWEVQFYRRSWAGRFLMIARSGYRVVTRDSRKAMKRLRERRADSADTDAPKPNQR
jgi:hypothetical protein